MTIIKKKNLVSMSILILILVSNFTFAQNDPVRNPKENILKSQQKEQTQNEIKSKMQSKSEEKNQIMNQIQNQNQEQSKSQNKNLVQNQNQIQEVPYIDLDVDGINDNKFDTDGDGIPNGQDPDYVKPNDGTVQQNTYGKGNKKNSYIWNPKDGTGYGSGAGNNAGTGSGNNKRGGRR